MQTKTRVVRVLAAGWLFHLKQLSRSSFFILTSVIQPVIFSSLAFFMFKAGATEESLLYAALGSGLMGIWSSTLFGSGGSIQWQRWEGTLEVLVAAPVPFVLVMIPITVATSSVGVYAVGATLLWGKLLFGIPLEFAQPLLFALSIPVTVLALGLLGLLLASTFVLYRHANALSNLLEYPVWLVTGLLVPLTLLPGWLQPVGKLLAPTWGITAVRGAAFGGEVGFALLMCVALGAIYLVLGSIFLKFFERLARERAVLSLT